MVHYLGIDDRFHARLVFYAAANSGVRVVDWADPTHPTEIAYYHAANDVKTAPGETDFTRPDIKYEPTNCLMFTGWNQGGEKTLELTNPQYNPCMRRAASGGGMLLDAAGKAKAQVDLNGQRVGNDNLVGKFSLSDRQTHEELRINRLTMLGSVRDACGGVPSASFTSMQFEGDGTYNGAPASFRVCVQQNANGAQAATPDHLYVACTSGCAYMADGAVQGSLKVNQQ